jgi:hypothetical protein
MGNGAAFSQPEEKSWELSMSGMLGTISSSSGSSASSTFEFIALDFRAGHFITENIEIEPEMQWLSTSDDKPLLSLSANMAYNFTLPNSTTTPFLLIGYGRTNSIPFINSLIFRTTDKHDISIINFGGGLKLFASKNAIFRIEYRHQRFSYTREYFSGETEYTVKYNNIMFGFSVFFEPAK